jgi:excisionase family DNA binding protein
MEIQFQNRQTFLERLDDRLKALEIVVHKLGSSEALLGRIAALEDNWYCTKHSFTLAEAAQYLGISKSMLYKHTHNGIIPCYRPGGKLLYFDKTELDDWIRERGKTTAEQDAIKLEANKIAEDYLKQNSDGKRKK